MCVSTTATCDIYVIVYARMQLSCGNNIDITNVARTFLPIFCSAMRCTQTHVHTYEYMYTCTQCHTLISCVQNRIYSYICRRVAELEMELECERQRREEVESRADQLRQQLQQQTLNLELSQEMLQMVSSNILCGTVETIS